jgi:hypothetical protein
MQNTITRYLLPAAHYIGFFPHTWVGEVAASIGAIRLFLTRKQVRIKGDIPNFLTLTNIKGGGGCRIFLIHHKLQVNKFKRGYTNLSHIYRSLKLASTVGPRTSNGLMFEQLEIWTKNSRNIRFWNSKKTRKSNKESRGRLLSLLGRTRSCSVSSPETGSVSISQIQSVFKRFI